MLSMLDALERDTFAFWEGCARPPGGQRGRIDDATWFRSGIPLANYNGVAGHVADVDAMLARVRAWNTPARWIVRRSTVADELEQALAERGCTLIEDAPGMVAPVDELAAPDMADHTVDVVRDDTQYDEWARVFCDAFGFPQDTSVWMREAHAWPCLHDSDRTYLLIRRRGQAVATGLLHSRFGLAGVYGIGVCRALQKQGLGRLATLATAREGARRGARLAVLQATAQGFPVYAKLGFQTITSFRSWRIA